MPKERENQKATVEALALSPHGEQRREELAKRLAVPLPDFVLSIEQAEVVFTIEPPQLPYAQADLKLLAGHMKRCYNLTFKPSKYSLALLESKDEAEMLEQARTLLQEDGESTEIEFTDGRYVISPRDFVPIRSVTLNREAVHVSVRGQGIVAENIAKETVEALWSSTGTAKPWEDIKPFVQMISYGTATKVNLGIPLESFLSPALGNLLRTDAASPDGYARRMVGRSARDQFKPPKEAVATWTVDDITIFLHVFNTQSGRSEQSQFRLTVRTRDEEGSGIFAAVSELPLTEHIEFLERIRTAVLAQGR